MIVIYEVNVGNGNTVKIEGSEEAVDKIILQMQTHQPMLDALEGVEIIYAELGTALPSIANTPAFDMVTEAIKAVRAAVTAAKGTDDN